MKIKNVSPHGDLDLPLLGRVIAKGEVFDVPDEDGETLLEQPFHWKAVTPAKPEPKAKAATASKEGDSK